MLKSEMSINGPEEGEVIAKIKVYNDAPASPDGGDIVFLGVGLRIIVGSERGSVYWHSRINKSEAIRSRGITPEIQRGNVGRR